MPKTAYELEREANIARNRALLEQLELKEAVSALGLSASSSKNKGTGKSAGTAKKRTHDDADAKAAPVQPARRPKRAREEEAGPRRQSARLSRRGAAVDANETPAKKRKREQEEEAQRKRDEEERLAAEERARAARMPRHHDLTLEDLADKAEWEQGVFMGLTAEFEALVRTPHPRRAAAQDAFVYDADDKAEAREVAALQKRVGSLKVAARAKVTQDRVYSAAYHPDRSKDLIFFGDKHGQVGIWDARATAEDDGDDDDDAEAEGTPAARRAAKSEGKVWQLQAHWPATSKSSISSIKFDPIDSHSVFTSAYDCTIRSLSFATGVSREVYSSGEVLITSIDLPPAGHELWASDASGGVTHLDLRQDKSKARWYELSDQKIGSVSINPVNPHLLLTASNNRTLKVWDTRALAGLPVADNGALDFDSDVIEGLLTSKAGKRTLRSNWPHGKSVSSAYWDPRGRTIVSTSYDDTLRLWDIKPSMQAKDAGFPVVQPFSKIRHDCQTGRWVTVFRAQWSPNPDVLPHFTVGNLDHSLEIYSCKGDALAKLSDRSLISATQAVTCSHPSIVERAASGNGSGRCILWAPPDEDASS